jgi:hypothetical protein
VWCLTSDETASVQYHIDYAELYRYETNIIYPPIYAGTCHLSPLNGDADMVGGDFQANVRGVDHYRQFGYKGKKASPEAFQEDLQSADWVRARYRLNRGILHDGNYPHLSTKVTYLKPGTKRVILGFNSFPAAVGECCTRAPEHSDAFNRTIKLYQTMAALGVPVTDGTRKSESNAEARTEASEVRPDSDAPSVLGSGSGSFRATSEERHGCEGHYEKPRPRQAAHYGGEEGEAEAGRRADAKPTQRKGFSSDLNL